MQRTSFTECFFIFIDAIYPVFIICTIVNFFLFIYFILTALCNLLGKLVNCLAYLHYVLCTVTLAITTFGKIKMYTL